MEQLTQAVELTVIGMSVVFIVLLLLTFILKIMGRIFGTKEEEKKEVKTESPVETEPEVSFMEKTSSSNPKMAAAIAAALTMYNEEKNND